MSLRPLVGHADLQERLRGAAEFGRLPQSLLFRGPPGVGKQRLALWLAALVLCDGDERPCGRCRSCRLADGLQHPDIHWFFPLPSPKGVSAEKRREKLEEARLAELESRRTDPLWPTSEDGAVSIFLPMVQEIRARASRRPAMGRSAVFVIGDADRMVPQASSPEAANAFLKLLEEPAVDTLLFLTTSRPGALLPTIRSRVLEVRVTPPPLEDAVRFLVEHADLDPAEARAAVRRVEGSIGLALDRMANPAVDLGEQAIQLLRCAMVGSRGDRLRLAATFPAAGARGSFSNLLEELERTIRDAAAVAAGAGDAALDARARTSLQGKLTSLPPEAFAGAARHVTEALGAAAGNGNPESIAAVLLADLASELGRSRTGSVAPPREPARGRR